MHRQWKRLETLIGDPCSQKYMFNPAFSHNSLPLYIWPHLDIFNHIKCNIVVFNNAHCCQNQKNWFDFQAMIAFVENVFTTCKY